MIKRIFFLFVLLALVPVRTFAFSLTPYIGNGDSVYVAWDLEDCNDENGDFYESAGTAVYTSADPTQRLIGNAGVCLDINSPAGNHMSLITLNDFQGDPIDTDFDDLIDTACGGVECTVTFINSTSECSGETIESCRLLANSEASFLWQPAYDSSVNLGMLLGVLLKVVGDIGSIVAQIILVTLVFLGLLIGAGWGYRFIQRLIMGGSVSPDGFVSRVDQGDEAGANIRTSGTTPWGKVDKDY